jgi:SH3 domain protein
MTSKKAKNRSDFRCEIYEDGRISFISRLNQNDFLSFFSYHTFMQRSHITKFLITLWIFCLSGQALGEIFESYVTDQLTTFLYKQPNSKKIVTYLNAGQKIRILTGNKENWNQIQLENGTTGWIESKYISANPGRVHKILQLNKEVFSLQKEIANHKKETLFLQKEVQRYRAENLSLRTQNFSKNTKIQELNQINANPIKVSQENHQLKKNIEFLKFDNSLLQRSLQDLKQQQESNWQTLLIIVSIITLLIGYIIGKRLSAKKKASWDI